MTYRVYFNRRDDKDGKIWSVDKGTQASEINVIDWKLHRCDADSQSDLSVQINPDTPTAWFVVPHAEMRIEHGVAHFFFDPDWRQPRIADGRT